MADKIDHLIATTSAQRRSAATDLIVLVAVAVILITMMDPGRGAIGGSVGLKLLFLGRMGVLLLIATWLLRRRHKTWREIGLRSTQWWRLIVAVLLGLLVIGAVAAATKALLVHAGYPVAHYSAFRPIRGNLAEYLFWLLPATLGSAAFGEEMIFRGFMLDAFERLLGGGQMATVLAILLQAIVFGLLHAYQGVGGLITTAVVGVLLGAVWWLARRNLWPGIIIHAILDGSAVTAVFLGLPVS